MSANAGGTPKACRRTTETPTDPARVAGDLLVWLPARQWGGLFNVIALLLFLFNTVKAVRSAKKSKSFSSTITPQSAN